MKLVLFSDLHLDAPFAWLGGNQDAARRRRQALRETLRRIAALAAEVRADALLCAGDLYEHERATDDTGEFLRRTFADLAPTRVFLAPGNHDWFGPRSLYHRVSWTENVHLFREAYLEPVELAAGLTLWGAGHRAPANTDGFLDGFHVGRDGVHLGLFHGSMLSPLTALEDGKVAHAPFELEQIARSGLAHAFLGHFHRPSSSAFHTYPGNPDPLTFGEDGERGAVVIEVGSDGGVRREARAVNVTRSHDVEVDVTGCASSQDVRDLVSSRLLGRAGVARVTLTGSLPSSVDVRLTDVQTVPNSLEGFIVRLNGLRAAYDYEAIATEATVRGQFVRDVQAADLTEENRRKILETGLRALEGRDELEVV